MIKSIRLENFQSHKNTTINFCDGVNAIVGLSDSGKTAILRALRWVVTNKPTGDAFQSYWGGDTSVTIILGDGTAITRKRTKSDNLYVKDDKEYRAFGQDVPEDIRKAFDLNDINLQGQMDAPFLLSQSPGEVAQILNKVVNLDVIDKAISSIRKQKLKADGDLKSELTRVSQLEGDLEKFAYLDELETEISGLESLDVLLGKARVGVAGLQAIVREI
jgi:DNA repair exonuclease SbcCD ATPase subunit